MEVDLTFPHLHKFANTKSAQVLKYVADYCKKHGYGPTTRDIMAEVGISSTSVTHYYLTPLLDVGYLAAEFSPKGNMLPRTIHPTEFGLDALALVKKLGFLEEGSENVE